MGKNVTVTMPENFSLAEVAAAVLKELYAPVARLDYLKSKPFLTDKEVEELYDIPAASLKTWRSRGGGPDYVQPYKNGSVAYEHEAVLKFKRRTRMEETGGYDHEHTG